MGVFFGGTIPYPFTAEISGKLSVDDGGLVQNLCGDVKDLSRANTLVLQNAGPNTVYFQFGPEAIVGTTLVTPMGTWDEPYMVLLAGAIISYPVGGDATMSIAAVCETGETATLFVSRGWGQ